MLLTTRVGRHPSILGSSLALAFAAALTCSACAKGAVSPPASPPTPAAAAGSVAPALAPDPTASAATSHDARAARLESRTRALVGAASRGDFAAASQDFGPAARSALPPEAFARTWQGLEGQVGALTAIESVALDEVGGRWSDDATCTFAHGRLVLRVAYDEADLVVGFRILPAASTAAAWAPPDYARPDAFEERAVTVGRDAQRPGLPGVLTLPKGVAAAPVVVLVHGSGPNDADESVGGTKVFKDLAWGLASRGVAVLRYVKRSRQDPAGIVTQKEEVLDAVRDAIALVRGQSGVDPARIFVLGHSQGGYLAPRIARENPGLAGVVILAGPSRPLTDSAIDQLTYLASLDARSAPTLDAELDAARKLKVKLEDPALSPDEEVTFLGARLKAAYFQDMRGYEPPAVARTLDCRVLVLQGERDYQVTAKDLAGWQRGLSGDSRATIKTYPPLNHLFVRGEGRATPAEYQRPGHVDGAVVADVASWVLSAR